MSSGASSQGSSVRSRTNNIKHYTENARLQEALKLYSTLEQDNERENNEDQSNIGKIAGISNEVLIHQSNGVASDTGSSIVSKLQQKIIKRTFQANYVLIRNQPLNAILYHIILALEFIQILFYIFYRLEIVNEFTTPPPPSPQTSQVLNTTTKQLDIIQSDGYTYEDLIQTFTIDQYFKFINFPLLILEGTHTLDSFLILLMIIDLTFLIFLVIAFAFANQLFVEAKKGELKEITKIIIRVFSVINVAYLTILQIPIVSTNLQCFLCGDNSDDTFGFFVECGSGTHQFMIALSTITLGFFLVFLFIEKNLFQSRNFKTPLPWGSLDRKLDIFKIGLKLILSLTFIFDKDGTIQGFANLLCSFLTGYILYIRLTKAIIFEQSIYAATIIYEGNLLWLFISIGCHQIGIVPLYTSTLLTIIVVGIFGSIALVFAKHSFHKDKMFSQKNVNYLKGLPLDVEIFFLRIFQAIRSHDSRISFSVMRGLIDNHIESCVSEKCTCLEIGAELDGMKLPSSYKVNHQQQIQSSAKQIPSISCSVITKQDKNFYDLGGFNMSISTDKEKIGISDNLTNSTHQSQFKKLPLNFRKKEISPSLFKNPVFNQTVKNDYLNQCSLSMFEEDKTPHFDKNADYKPNFNSNHHEIIHSPMTKIHNKKALQLTFTDTMSNTKKIGRVNIGKENFNTSMNSKDNLYGATSFFESAQNLSQIGEHLIDYLLDDELQVGIEISGPHIQRLQFQFLALMIQEAVDSFPKSVDLKLLNSQIQREMLENDFKAIFELMNCENCNPNFSEQYTIFVRKVEIEQKLIISCDKNFQQVSGNIDISIVYQYEKLFQKYALLEYVTANSALGFWKELMAKTIEATAMQIKGIEISRNYALIQGVANQMMKIYPNEIKFLHRYGLFLMQIVNNEYDALTCFEKAVNTFQNKMQRKAGGVQINEQLLFGENTASGIVIISATPTQIGYIINANQQVHYQLGYKPKELHGKNVTAMIPKQIAKSHDYFIQRYFETNKSDLINRNQIQFALTSSRYLKHMHLLVKVYPQMNNKILFVGFMQSADSFEDMKPPKTEFENRDYQYIVTDKFGNITNVTEGLNQELGLNSKFFIQPDSLFATLININLICPDILEEDQQDILENEGTILNFDTRHILDFVEIEELTSEEVLDVRSKLSIFQAYVQMKKVVFDKDRCAFNLYRLVLIATDIDAPISFQIGAAFKSKCFQESKGGESTANHNLTQSKAQNDMLSKMSINDDMDLSSVSSTASALNSFNKMVQDFKKALGERKTPRNLVYLNRFISLILMLSLILSSVSYFFQNQYLTKTNLSNQHQLQSQSRQILQIMLQTNYRSLVNIANDLEPNTYSGDQLIKINRFNYLSHLIQSQAVSLKEAHDYISLSMKYADYYDYADKAEYEESPMQLYRLDFNNRMYYYEVPYKAGFDSYLNYIQQMNGTTMGELQFPKGRSNVALLQASPSFALFNDTSIPQKNAEFLLLNGFRNIREKTMTANSVNHERIEDVVSVDTQFIAFMAFGLIISVTLVLMILCQIWITDKNKAEILSLYATLSVIEIKRIYDSCDLYLDALMIEGGVHCKPFVHPDDSEQTSKQDLPSNAGPTFNPTENAGNRQLNETQVSEEEKEEQQFNAFMLKKRQAKRMFAAFHSSGTNTNHNPKVNTSQSHSGFLGQDYYSEIVKHAVSNAKAIQQRGEMEALNRANGNLKKKKKAAKQIEESSTERRLVDSHRKASVRKDIKRKRANKKITEPQSIKSNNLFSSNQKAPAEIPIEVINSEDEKSEPLDGSDIAAQVISRKLSQSKAEMSNLDFKEDEIEQRRQQFLKTVKSTRNWRFLSLNALSGILFASFYLFSYFYHDDKEQALNNFNRHTPLMFNRYTQIMLSYSLIRERIINNHSLASFYNPDSPYSNSLDLDEKFKIQSLNSEQLVANFKIAAPNGLEQISDFLYSTDSQKFCANVIGEFAGNIEEKVVVTRNMEKKLKDIKRKAYQTQLSTVIAACNAASEGNLEKLKLLKGQGVDMNIGDYDKRTPLHVSTGGGHINVVRFLIELGVTISPVDRWGATPLNDAVPYPDITDLLKTNGAVIGIQQPPYTSFSVTVSDDQFRLYYAAFFGDVEMMKNLRLLGWNVNGQDYDGRTALGVASSEGNLEVVKYLVSKGADLSIKDARGNDPLSDANRENRTATINYLSSIIYESLIRDYCSKFYDGLLEKGIQQAFGVFHKRLSDLQIAVNHTQSYSDLLKLLYQNTTFLNMTNNDSLQNNVTPSVKLPSPKKLSKTNQTQVAPQTVQDKTIADQSNIDESSTVYKSIEMFISTQELYLHKVVDKYVVTIQNTSQLFMDNYKYASQAAFILFITFQLAILLYFRQKLINVMSEEVFQSRGILNLIPENFFEQNRETVEKLIKKIKD